MFEIRLLIPIWISDGVGTHFGCRRYFDRNHTFIITIINLKITS